MQNPSRKFRVILATDSNGTLGIQNRLPWNSPSDMEYFRQVTSVSPVPDSNIVICGRKTWDSMGRRRLPHRRVFVVSRTLQQRDMPSNVQVFHSFYAAIQQGLHTTSCYSVWVIGGKSIYLQALYHPACGDVYWNRIEHHTTPSTDTSFVTRMKSIESLYRTHYTSQDPMKTVTFRVGSVEGAEIQYLRLLSEVLHFGSHRTTRNARTRSLFDRNLSWDMANGFPLITTKKMFWKGIVEELLFFIRGETQTKRLEEKGVRIWKGNTSREFLDSIGKPHMEEGCMGPMYGYQWRSFGKPYPQSGADDQGIDQLQEFIEEIQSNPNSRRHLMTTFHPAQVKQGVLYPCHSLIIQAYVGEDSRLSLNMYQRSADVFLGLPFNIASTSLLCLIVANLCGLEAGRVSITIGDAHIYEAHMDPCEEQLRRECYPLCSLRPLPIHTLQDVEEAKLDYFVLKDYKSHPRIPASMIA